MAKSKDHVVCYECIQLFVNSKINVKWKEWESNNVRKEEYKYHT